MTSAARSSTHKYTILSLVWGMIAITIVAVVAVVAGGYQIMTDVTRQANQVDVKLEQNRASIHQLEALMVATRSATLKLFYEQDMDNHLARLIKRYADTITPVLERVAAEDLQQQFQRSYNELSRLLPQTKHWLQRQMGLKQEYLHGDNRSSVRNLLQRLRSFADIHLGQQRLADAIDIRNWRQASAPQANEIAAKILDKRGERWFLLLSEIKNDVAKLTRYCEMLISAVNVSQLADVRDNLLKPSIEHLQRSLVILDEVPGKSAAQALQALEDLKRELFGEKYAIDQQHQTIITSGGLYQISADRLQLRRQQHQLENKLQQLYVILENINAQLIQRMQTEYAVFGKSAKIQLHQGLRRARTGAGVVLLLLIILGVVVSRMIQRQIHKLSLLQRHNELILHAAGDGIVGLDVEGRTTFVNPAAASMLGYDNEEMVGQCFASLVPVCSEDGERLSDAAHPAQDYISLDAGATRASSNEYFQRRDGSIFCAQYIATPLTVEHNRNDGAVLVFKDISEQQQDKKRLLRKKQQLDYLANHDVLTGLPNRRLFRDKLHLAIEACRREGGELAIFFIDLDRFKNINDSLGHEMGDLLLRAVAVRLNKSAGETTMVARLGGDEFVVLMEKISVAEQIAAEAQRLLRAINTVYEISGERLFVSASIGISRFPHDADDETALMSDADVAMYYAKNSGKNNYQFYTPDMNARARELQELEGKLRDGIEKEQFVLYYQPQLDINTHRLIGAEVLIRWNHPQLGVVSPLDFIPLAEETGLIVPMGAWVLNSACTQLQQWLQQGMEPIQVAVNLSAVQFKSGLEDTVVQVLEQTGLNPELLELEITESMLMDDDDRILTILNNLKQRGINFSVDDFGTGFSSLSYLKRLPVDKLKIDRSFVSDVLIDPSDAAIANSVISLGHNLQLEVIAEGVETVEQEQFLVQHGCDSVQGYLYAKPMPATDFIHWVRQRAERDSS